MVEAVRPASRDDLPVLIELATSAVYEQIEARGGRVWAHREAIPTPPDETLMTSIDNPDELVVVGTIGDVVVGYGRARSEVLRNGNRLGVISDIFVTPGAREVGVGELLIDSLVSWAKEQGCGGVDATVLPGNRQAKNFFETAHFTARAIVVHRSLQTPSDS